MVTKDFILRTAEDLLLEKGLHSLDIQLLAERAGISHAEMFQYFPSRELLCQALLQRLIHDFGAWSRRIDEQESSPSARLEAFFLSYRKFLFQGKRICPAGVLEAEINSMEGALQHSVQHYFRLRLNWLRQVLSDGLYMGDFRFEGPAEEMAVFILSAMQGVVQISRTQQEPSYFLAVVRMLRERLQQPLAGAHMQQAH